MKIQTFGKLLFLVSSLLWNTCNKKANLDAAVVVTQDGKVTAFGQAVALDNLQAALMDSLVHLSVIPDTLSIVFQGEVLMGTRGEVRTQVDDAITAAKEAQMHPVVVQSTFWQQHGKDCDQPDTLRTNCAIINLVYPKVYYKENALMDSVNAWVNPYLVSVLASGAEDEQTAAATKTLEAGAKVFFGVHESYKGSAMYGGFDAESKYDVLLNDGKYLTLQIESYTFQGGAHGSPDAIVETFDASSGKKLAWNDLVNDTLKLQALAEQKFREVKAEAFDDGFNFDEIFLFKLPDNYGLTDTGIYFYYVPYEVGPYYLGSTTFTIPFAALGELSKAKPNAPSVSNEDLGAITDVIHSFYEWYNAFQQDEKRNIVFVSDKSAHLKLDNAKLDQYFANLQASGFISKAFVDNEKVLLKKCEALWQKENKDEVPSCLDADRFFCAQDWDLDFWTKSPVSATSLGADKAMATISGKDAESTQTRQFELQKENGKWLITKIDCDMGLE